MNKSWEASQEAAFHHGACLYYCLSFCHDFPQWWAGMRKYKPNKSSPTQAIFAQSIFSAATKVKHNNTPFTFWWNKAKLESVEGQDTDIKNGGVLSSRKGRSLLSGWEECVYDLLVRVKHKFPLGTGYIWSDWTQLLMEVIFEIRIVNNFHIFPNYGICKTVNKIKKKESLQHRKSGATHSPPGV